MNKCSYLYKDTTDTCLICEQLTFLYESVA